MLLSVPGGISTLSLPATVTVPGFVHVMILAVTPLLANKEPSIGLESGDQLVNLHLYALFRRDVL